MKILICSTVFYPSVGGMESVMSTLAHEFVREGHEVVLFCETSCPENGPSFPFEVVRRPPPRKLLSLLKWSDLYLQSNVTLKYLWPLAFVRRPLVVVHHTWYRRVHGATSWQDILKRRICRRVVNVAVSEAIARDIGAKCEVIANPYDDELFSANGDGGRSKDLVFVGRLVSDKGADLLLESLSQLNERGLKPTLSIAGEGPERSSLESYCRAHGLQEQVSFEGTLRGDSLASLLREHSIMVVPSRWNEPFGIVALEGIACGCYVIGSAGGGLPEAIGPCGTTFPNGDSRALAALIEQALKNPAEPDKLQTEEHLRCFRKRTVAGRYIQVLTQALA